MTQSEQFVFCVRSYLPAAQGRQNELPEVDEYVPSAQVKQASAVNFPSIALNVPAAHLVQASLAVPLEDVL